METALSQRDLYLSLSLSLWGNECSTPHAMKRRRSTHQDEHGSDRLDDDDVVVVVIVGFVAAFPPPTHPPSSSSSPSLARLYNSHTMHQQYRSNNSASSSSSSSVASSSSSSSSSKAYVDPFAEDQSGGKVTNGSQSDATNLLGPDGINADEGILDSASAAAPLESAWRFWLEKPLRRVGEKGTTNVSDDVLQDKDRLRTLFEFKTVQGFWRCYNASIKDIGRLDGKEYFHLMRKTSDTEIRPLWEDPANANGGEWVIRVGKERAGEVWSDLLLAVIGEQLSDHKDEICGVSVSPRALDYVIQVWVRSLSDEATFQNIKNIIDGNSKMSIINSHFFRKHQANPK